MVWGHKLQHGRARKSQLSPSLWLQGISTCNTLANSHLQPRKADCKSI